MCGLTIKHLKNKYFKQSGDCTENSRELFRNNSELIYKFIREGK